MIGERTNSRHARAACSTRRRDAATSTPAAGWKIRESRRGAPIGQQFKTTRYAPPCEPCTGNTQSPGNPPDRLSFSRKCLQEFCISRQTRHRGFVPTPENGRQNEPSAAGKPSQARTYCRQGSCHSRAPVRIPNPSKSVTAPDIYPVAAVLMSSFTAWRIRTAAISSTSSRQPPLALGNPG